MANRALISTAASKEAEEDNFSGWSGLTLTTLNRTILNRDLGRGMTYVGAPLLYAEAMEYDGDNP